MCRVVVFLCLQFHAAYAVRKDLRHHLVENASHHYFQRRGVLEGEGICLGTSIIHGVMVPGDKEWLWLGFRNIRRPGHLESLDCHENLME